MKTLKLKNTPLNSPHKIVVVDDDQDDFILTEYFLKKMEFTNELLWLPSGKDLIDFLLCQGEYTQTGEANPLLIFLDINMPCMNAEEVLSFLQRQNKIESLRFVLLSNADPKHLETTRLRNFPFIQKNITLEKFQNYLANQKELFIEEGQ